MNLQKLLYLWMKTLVSPHYQSSASVVNSPCDPTSWYSDTFFSKKFVLPCSEIISIQSNGLDTLYTFEEPSVTSRRSAQYYTRVTATEVG